MWALFVKVDGKWHFKGITPHEEFVTEFEESEEEQGNPTRTFSLD